MRSAWRRKAVRIAAMAALVPLASGTATWLALTYGIGPGEVSRLLFGESSRPRDVRSRAAEAVRDQTRGATRLERSTEVRVRFRGPPRGGLLFELDTGKVLWRRHPVRRLPIASLTKIATAIVTVERTRARERLRIPRSALHVPGSGIGRLRRGKRVRVDALLYGLMLASANDAAVALARHVGGSRGSFVRLMNRRARRLGLTCTRFVSPHGLESRNRSCPADLAVLAQVAMSKPRIARVVRHARARVRFPLKRGRLELSSTNPLLRLGYRGTIGLKTGYTDDAGHCFVGVAKRGRRRLGVVLLHSPEPYRQARRLLDAGFRRLGRRR